MLRLLTEPSNIAQLAIWHLP